MIFICGICRRVIGHDPRCPNYVPPKAKEYCCECGQGIYADEEYIQNDDGECIHMECVPGIRWMVDWLGYGVKSMDEE